MLKWRRNSDPSGNTKISAQPSKAAERRASLPFYSFDTNTPESAIGFKSEL